MARRLSEYNANMANMRRAGLTAFRLFAAVTLSACIVIFALRTSHWPILGDASLIHYAIFLMDRGLAPYREIAELNMPGSYLVEWAAIHLLGGGDVAWRIFDLLITASSILAMVVITFPLDWFAGFWAGSLFLLIHGRDGIIQAGQRDLVLSVCSLAGYVCLFLSLRRNKPFLALPFGLLLGLAGAIKPPFLLLGPVLLLMACIERRRQEHLYLGLLAYGIGGWLLPLAGSGVFLWREHAISAFFTMTRDMLIYHTTLARRPLGYLLLHSLSPLMPLVAVWLVILILQRRQIPWERRALWIGLGFGLLAYLSQAKGYAYQRYPILAFLLLLMSEDFSVALRNRGAVRILGIGGLAFGALFLAPVSTAMAGRYDWRDLGTVGMLEKDLKNLGADELSGGVQCVDSIAGCTNVLYRMKLDERSYLFYDEFLFGPDSVPAVQQNREKFWRDIRRDPPAIMIVTAPLFPSGPDGYEKLSLWPQFDAYLDEQYFLHLQRTPDHPVQWWSRAEVPAGYRIYLRKDFSGYQGLHHHEVSPSGD